MKKIFKNKNNLIIGLFGVVLLMGIGFAAFSQRLTITETSGFDTNWNVYISNADFLEEESSEHVIGKATVVSRDTASLSTELKYPGDLATYRITVKNASQTDYTGATSASVGTTYYTGKVSATDRLVTTSVDIIADYVDNSLVYRLDDNPSTGWESMEQTSLESIEKMEAEGYLDRDIKLHEKDIHQILVNQTLTSIQLAPGQVSNPIELVLTKTISAADDTDDLSYDNIAEILQYTNLVGRRADLPGNQDPTKDTIEADADRTETIIILPPFGANKAVASYIAIAIAVLAVVAGGVIVVKKKLLNK